jgi:hypothetical protein
MLDNNHIWHVKRMCIYGMRWRLKNGGDVACRQLTIDKEIPTIEKVRMSMQNGLVIIWVVICTLCFSLSYIQFTKFCEMEEYIYASCLIYLLNLYTNV